MSLGDTGRLMLEGEFESLRAIRSVCPELAPYVYNWGCFKGNAPSGLDTHFMLADYHVVGEQPPEPLKFTARLAELHKNSVSPTGKFGFHITTCHARLPQVTNCWEESWAVLFRKQMAQMIKLDTEKNGDWPEFRRVCDLILDRVIPRLLEPLQSEGRFIKPCLVHGDLWDENAATDGTTGEPFVFDAGSFYAHNEYEQGNWRAPRHRLSRDVYVENYKRHFPASEPSMSYYHMFRPLARYHERCWKAQLTFTSEHEWDDRNLLYSLRYDLGAAILIPGCNLRQV